MTETIIMQAAVAIASVWENKARASGKPFWVVVTDRGEKYTSFFREFVSRFIDGFTPKDANNAKVWNFDPPLNTVIFFEVREKGSVLVKNPDVGAVPAPAPLQSQPGTQTQASDTPAPAGTPPLPTPSKPPYRSHPGYAKAKESPEAAKILAEIEHDKNIHIARMNAGTGAIAVINTWITANSSGGLTIHEVEAVFKTEFESIADTIFNYTSKG